MEVSKGRSVNGQMGGTAACSSWTGTKFRFCTHSKTSPTRMGWQAQFMGNSPLANPIKPAGQWNSYDIVFRGPRFDDEGDLRSSRDVDRDDQRRVGARPCGSPWSDPAQGTDFIRTPRLRLGRSASKTMGTPSRSETSGCVLFLPRRWLSKAFLKIETRRSSSAYFPSAVVRSPKHSATSLGSLSWSWLCRCQ